MKTEIRNSISGLLILACFALLPSVQATPDPAPRPGTGNVADGNGALANVTGAASFNSAFGNNALNNLTNGNNNAAQGNSALFTTNGSKNTAVGVLALRLLTDGADNTAVGYRALNVSLGSSNAAVGSQAGVNLTSGDFNTFLGAAAGFNVETANGTICIGTEGADENSRTFVGNLTDDQAQNFNGGTVKLVTVRVADGRLGVSSLNLADASSQQKVEEQQASIDELQKRIEVLTAQLKEQAAQIQKVSAQLEVNKSAPRTVANK